jgi:hypothetical protein
MDYFSYMSETYPDGFWYRGNYYTQDSETGSWFSSSPGGGGYRLSFSSDTRIVGITDWYSVAIYKGKGTITDSWTTVYIDSESKVTVERVWNYGPTENSGNTGVGGHLTFSKAKAHYQFGGGVPVNVDLSSIDLSLVSMADFNEKGLATVRLDTRHFSNVNDALVHGTITLQQIGNTNQAKIALNTEIGSPIYGQPAGMYDFEMQTWSRPINWIRNPATFLGGLINSTSIIPGSFVPIPIYTGGTPYPIYYNGTITIPW